MMFLGLRGRALPETYLPRIEVKIVEVLKAQIIKPNEALRLRARVDFAKAGVRRIIGEEWLVTATGAYMPGVEASGGAGGGSRTCLSVCFSGPSPILFD